MSSNVWVNPYRAEVFTPLDVKIGRAISAKCARYARAMPSSKKSFFCIKLCHSGGLDAGVPAGLFEKRYRQYGGSSTARRALFAPPEFLKHFKSCPYYVFAQSIALASRWPANAMFRTAEWPRFFFFDPVPPALGEDAAMIPGQDLDITAVIRGLQKIAQQDDRWIEV